MDTRNVCLGSTPIENTHCVIGNIAWIRQVTPYDKEENHESHESAHPEQMYRSQVDVYAFLLPPLQGGRSGRARSLGYLVQIHQLQPLARNTRLVLDDRKHGREAMVQVKI